MTTATLTEFDLRVREAVMRQLEWDPEVDASAVGVAASKGAVTLTGFTDTCAGKLEAERAAKRVHGVRAVANEIEVRLKVGRGDTEIAKDAVRVLELRNVPASVQAAVHDGHVTLTGSVRWLFEKLNAEGAVRHLCGVRRVVNYIVVQPQVIPVDIRHRIVKALHQHADVDARHIEVAVAAGTVTLTGFVDTWLQRDEAERAAERAPGVVRVDNRIVVQSFHDAKSEDVGELC